MNRNERAVLRLVDLVYSCVDGDTSWSSFLDAVAEHFGAHLAGITTNSYLQAVNSEVDPVELAKYQTHYLAINPWHIGDRDAAYPEGRILISEEVLPFNVYRRTAFYNEWGKKNRVTHAVGGAIRAGSTMTVFFSINRGDAEGPYGEEEREIAQLLMPHIQRAASLHDRMHALEQRAWVLDTLAFPMFYVDSAGNVRWANDAAENLLRSGRGLQLRGARLHAQVASEDAALQKMLGEGRTVILQNISGCGGWLRVTRTGDGTEISLFLTRPPRRIKRLIGVHGEASGFLIFVAMQAIDGNTLVSRLRKTWGLTAAEAALALELLESDGLQTAAAKLQVSRNTAKSQLSSIFQKSGARRQSELVRKLLALAAIASDPQP